jgi:hypothetical protein
MSSTQIPGVADRDAGTARSSARPSISLSDADRPSGAGTALALLGIVPLIYLALLLPDAASTWIIREDHPIELTGALSLLAASIACLVLWRRVRDDAHWPALRRLGLLALALLFFFGFGEEMSWGQRLFGFGTPGSLQASNVQDETTVHNLKLFSGPLEMDTLFQFFWLLIGVIVPALALWRTPRRHLERLVPILPIALAPIFLLNQVLTRGFAELFTRHPDLYNSSQFTYEHAIFETKETVASLLLASGFWLLVLHHRKTGAQLDADADASASMSDVAVGPR